MSTSGSCRIASGGADALLVALRERADDRRVAELEAAPVAGLFDPLLAVAEPDALDRRAELEVLPHPHLHVERVRFRKIADAAADLGGLAEAVEAGDAGGAARRRNVAGEDAHRRRLAGAVGAEEADDLALADLERYVLERENPGIRLDEVFGFDHPLTRRKDP
jgi:hypothetical protein